MDIGSNVATSADCGDDDNDDDGWEGTDACASRFLPNASEKMFPAMTGASETKPQFYVQFETEAMSVSSRRIRILISPRT